MTGSGIQMGIGVVLNPSKMWISGTEGLQPTQERHSTVRFPVRRVLLTAGILHALTSAFE
jgi:hypothetical protein